MSIPGSTRGYWHRYNVASNDTASTVGATLGALVDDANGQNKAFAVKRCRNIEIGAWGVGSDNDTYVVTAVGFDAGVNGLFGVGRTLWVATHTFGTTTSVNIDPLTGAAAASTTFRAADTIAFTTQNTSVSVYDGSGANGYARLVYDPLDHEYVFHYITSISGITGAYLIARHLRGA